jgi:hypothetical protein
MAKSSDSDVGNTALKAQSVLDFLRDVKAQPNDPAQPQSGDTSEAIISEYCSKVMPLSPEKQMPR